MISNNKDAYDFSFSQINGEDFKLADLKGKVILIVNTASKCGFTKQYEGLQQLYETYEKAGLVVIAVPSNDFGGQEPGNNEQIQEFCKINYGVTFPVMQKVSVSGTNAHPFYAWAKQKLGFGTAPKWNFHKYVINRKGQLVDYFHSTTKPDSPRLIKLLDKLFNEPANQ
ncbi:MAG: glutathione peroxidase [Legionellales bacterium]|nr:glutathione peroxidase [Legionellales bacterium]